VAPRPLAAGQTEKLPDGAGSITYLGYQQWVSLAITYDPGQLPALISGFAALAGLILSFLVRRRRVFVRAVAGPDGGTEVSFGGLARSDAAGGFDTEFAELSRLLRAEHDGGSMQARQVGDGTVDGPADFDDLERPQLTAPAAPHDAATPANGKTTAAESAAAANPETLTGREEE